MGGKVPGLSSIAICSAKQEKENMCYGQIIIKSYIHYMTLNLYIYIYIYPQFLITEAKCHDWLLRIGLTYIHYPPTMFRSFRLTIPGL